MSTSKTAYALGLALRNKRSSKGLTLRDIQKRSYVALGHISDIERGKKDASSLVLESILNALEYPVSEYFSDVARLVS
jgi:transcriptional regulator with XRE-family HTH domain